MESTPISRISNPSPYQLPQHVSNDRQRARQLTIAINKDRYPFAHDEGLDEEQRLPARPKSDSPDQSSFATELTLAA